MTRQIVWIPADGEEIPALSVSVDATINGAPLTVLFSLVEDSFATLGVLHYDADRAMVHKALPPNSNIPHAFDSWPRPE